jgi:hypothetical protein
LQVPGVFRRSPLHDGGTQIVSAAYTAQPPMPSQVPVCPHDCCPLSVQTPWGSPPPASTGQQVPTRPIWLQLRHGPRQPTLQQTPSVQNPDAQSMSFAHSAPGGLGPQLPLTQATPLAQSALDRQVSTQACVAGSQLNGAHTVAGPALQRPRPSQTFTPTTEPSEHDPGWHTVPATWLRQLPAPSQAPSRPQVDTSDAGHSLAARGAPPVGTKVQIPSEP